MSNDWERCPRCDSARTETMGKFKLFFILIGAGSCSIWLGIIFPPIWIASAVLILGSPVALFAVKMNSCKDCNYHWREGRAEENKQALEDKARAKAMKK